MARHYPSLTDQRDFFSKLTKSFGEPQLFDLQKSWAGLLLHPDGDMAIVPMKATDFNMTFVYNLFGLTTYSEILKAQSPVLSLVFDIDIQGFYNTDANQFPNFSASNLFGFDIRGPVFIFNNSLWEQLQPDKEDEDAA